MSTVRSAGVVSSGRARWAADSSRVSTGGVRRARARTASRFVRRRWPALVALVLAWPVGVAAAVPVINGGDLLVWGIAALFTWGVSR